MSDKTITEFSCHHNHDDRICGTHDLVLYYRLIDFKASKLYR